MTAISQAVAADVLVPVNPATLEPAGSLPTTPPEALGDLGPLVTEGQRGKVEPLVSDAVDHGADVVSGGGRPSVGPPGWLHEPTVLAGELASSRIRREEVFGPAGTVVRIDNESDGIGKANDSPFGLVASVWTRDRERGRRIAAFYGDGLGAWARALARHRSGVAQLVRKVLR